MSNIETIACIAKVSTEEARVLESLIDAQYLVDWSEASVAKIRRAIKDIKFFIANGHSWEVKVA